MQENKDAFIIKCVYTSMWKHWCVSSVYQQSFLWGLKASGLINTSTFMPLPLLTVWPLKPPAKRKKSRLWGKNKLHSHTHWHLQYVPILKSGKRQITANIFRKCPFVLVKQWRSHLGEFHVSGFQMYSPLSCSGTQSECCSIPSSQDTMILISNVSRASIWDKRCALCSLNWNYRNYLSFSLMFLCVFHA